MLCEQVNVPSADLTVALLRLPDRSLLLASVYVEGCSGAALDGTMELLNEAIYTAQLHASMPLSPATSTDITNCGVETKFCRNNKGGGPYHQFHEQMEP
jgi:hypothetical protein